jgi:hypothetical protein
LQCFDRPAFKTPFDQEISEEDFIQAIEDTLTAINTGKLFDRKNRELLAEGISRHNLSNSASRSEMARISSILQNIRDTYKLAIDNERIRTFEANGKYVMPNRDPAVAKQIDQLKDEAVEAVKSICRKTGIEPYGLEKTEIGRRADIPAVSQVFDRASLEEADVLERKIGEFRQGTLVKVTWNRDKRHGITEYGVVKSADKSQRLYSDKPHINIVFTNARNGETEIAGLDLDNVAIVDRIPKPSSEY